MFKKEILEKLKGIRRCSREIHKFSSEVNKCSRKINDSKACIGVNLPLHTNMVHVHATYVRFRTYRRR